MSSTGIPLTNSAFPAGSSGRTATIAVDGVPGAYVVDCIVTDPSTGETTAITHLLDCATPLEVQDQMAAYFADNF